MGLWNLLKNANNPEGIREAMRMAYDKHYRLALEGRIGQGDVDPHHAALFGALASRLQVSGVTPNELMVWVEAGPFLWLDKQTGREGIAEYVVYIERPADARLEWLTTVVRQGCANGSGEEWFEHLKIAARVQDAPWLRLTGDRDGGLSWDFLD